VLLPLEESVLEVGLGREQRGEPDFHTGTAEENAKSSVAWIGAIGWFGFLLSVLATIVFSVLLVIHRSRRRSTV
jgi:hypothetical protein